MFTLNDGTEWAGETCQAEHHSVCTVTRGVVRGTRGLGAVVSHRLDAGAAEGRLPSVLEVVPGWEAGLQTFALAHCRQDAAAAVEGVCRQGPPAVRHAPGGGRPSSPRGSRVGGEAKDSLMGLHDEHKATWESSKTWPASCSGLYSCRQPLVAGPGSRSRALGAGRAVSRGVEAVPGVGTRCMVSAHSVSSERRSERRLQSPRAVPPLQWPTGSQPPCCP